MPVFSLISRFSHCAPVALDLGTAWTRLATREGQRFTARTERQGHRGMQGGAICDPATCAEIVRELFHSVRPWLPPFRRRLGVVATIAASATGEETRALTGTLDRSGAWEVVLVPQPLAAAIGAGLDPGSEYAQMVVDVGDGFTEYAVLRSGKVEASSAVKIGCGAIREAAASSAPGTSAERQAAFAGALDSVAEGALRFFCQLPARMACEVIENGVLLVGGGALLHALPARLAERTGLSIRVPANPLTAVIEGAAGVIPYATLPEHPPREINGKGGFPQAASSSTHGHPLQSRAEHPRAGG